MKSFEPLELLTRMKSVLRRVFSMNISEQLYDIFTLDEYCQGTKAYLRVQTEMKF